MTGKKMRENFYVMDLLRNVFCMNLIYDALTYNNDIDDDLKPIHPRQKN